MYTRALDYFFAKSIPATQWEKYSEYKLQITSSGKKSKYITYKEYSSTIMNMVIWFQLFLFE